MHKVVNIKITWKYCLAFYCLIMLYSSLHELIHHFSGYILCGEWGYKTFNYFQTACEANAISYMATYAGPVFSFAMMWVGAYMLNRKNTSPYKRHFAFALIFAQMPLQRMVMCFFKMNDEYYASSKLFGKTELVYWMVIITVWICCVPPLIKAYKAIENKNRLWWFLFYLVLFPYLLWGPVFMLLEYLLVEKQVMNGNIIGIANLFILNEVITIAGYLYFRKHLNTARLNQPSRL